MTLPYIQLLYENAPNKLIFREFKHFLVKKNAYQPFIQNIKSQNTDRLIYIPHIKKPQKWVDDAFTWIYTPQTFPFWKNIDISWKQIIIPHTT